MSFLLYHFKMAFSSPTLYQVSMITVVCSHPLWSVPSQTIHHLVHFDVTDLAHSSLVWKPFIRGVVPENYYDNCYEVCQRDVNFLWYLRYILVSLKTIITKGTIEWCGGSKLNIKKQNLYLYTIWLYSFSME